MCLKSRIHKKFSGGFSSISIYIFARVRYSANIRYKGHNRTRRLVGVICGIVQILDCPRTLQTSRSNTKLITFLPGPHLSYNLLIGAVKLLKEEFLVHFEIMHVVGVGVHHEEVGCLYVSGHLPKGPDKYPSCGLGRISCIQGNHGGGLFLNSSILPNCSVTTARFSPA